MDEPETRRHVHGHVLVAFLESVVLFDVVQVISPDNHGPVHFHLGDDTGENATTDGDLADKGALFVNVVSLASLSGNFEAKSWADTKSGICLFKATFFVMKNGRLLLKSSLSLIRHGLKIVDVHCTKTKREKEVI